MRKLFYPLLFAVLLPLPVLAQTADEIIAKYIKTIGGMDKIQAIKSLRRSGKFIGGGGFEAPTTEINQRPSMVRQEITIQGLTGITA
ncbi:MAG TPA: hypothetical protein VL633_13080, partial [Bacteroidota bacterium]|nr:hypothetical protein [Bacteroidota bacterium]